MADFFNGQHPLHPGNQTVRIVIVHGVQGRQQHGGFLTVIVGYRADGLNTPFGDGSVGKRLADTVERDDKVGVYQLDNQYKGHDGHSRHGGVNDAGNHQAQHVRGIGDQEHGDAQIQQETAGDGTGGGHVHAKDQENAYHDHHLKQADHGLIDHMG